MNIDTLKKQLKSTETEFEQAKAHAYRCEGVIELLKHLIAAEPAENEEVKDDRDS